MGTIENYVPRHIRLGVSCVTPVVEAYSDVVVQVPVVDETGSPVQLEIVHKQVPVAVVMEKYRLQHFKLSAMVDNGVPLKVVNINRTKSMDIAQLEHICASVDGAEKFVQKSLEHQEELASFFNSENYSENV